MRSACGVRLWYLSIASDICEVGLHWGQAAEDLVVRLQSRTVGSGSSSVGVVWSRAAVESGGYGGRLDARHVVRLTELSIAGHYQRYPEDDCERA